MEVFKDVHIIGLIITGLLTVSVAIQGFFMAKVWSHERRLTSLETQHFMIHKEGVKDGKEMGQNRCTKIGKA